MIMVQILIKLFPHYRWSGILYLIPLAYLIKATTNIRMVMHPVDPIGNSGSMQIKLTFYVLTLLLTIWAGLMIWLSRFRN